VLPLDFISEQNFSFCVIELCAEAATEAASKVARAAPAISMERISLSLWLLVGFAPRAILFSPRLQNVAVFD
jgi:hypothetical protein